MIFFNHVTIYIKKWFTIVFLGDKIMDDLSFFVILPFLDFLHLAHITFTCRKNKVS